MSRRSLRSAEGRKPATSVPIDTDSDSGDDVHISVPRAKRGRPISSSGRKTRGRPKKHNSNLDAFDPPPTPGSHPSEEDDDIEPLPVPPVRPFYDEDQGPPPTPGSSGFDTIKLGSGSTSTVPSLVPNANNGMSNLVSSTMGLNIDQPPPTPRPFSPIHGTHGSSSSMDIGHGHDKMLKPPTTRSVRASSSASMMSSSQMSALSSSHPHHQHSSSMSKNKKHKSDHKKAKMDYHLGIPMDELIQNGLLYFLLMQQRKIPVKRADLVKNAMNGQFKDFKPMIDKLGLVFQDVFGINIVGLEGPGVKPGQHAFYILTSKYSSTLVDSVTYHTPENNFKRTILFLVLGTIYMMGRSLEEAAIWKLITATELHNEVGVKKVEELRRFLKSEYVMPMYLTLEESQGPDVDTTIVRYNWGARADKEFSKFGLLRFVAKQYRKKPSDFAVQFGVAMKEDKEAVEKYLAEVSAREERGEEDPDLLPPLVQDPYEDDGPHFNPPGTSTSISTTTKMISGKKSFMPTDSSSKRMVEDDNEVETEDESEEVSEVEVEQLRQPRSRGKSMRIMRQVYEEVEEEEDEEEGEEEEEEEEGEEDAVSKHANFGSDGEDRAHFDEEDE